MTRLNTLHREGLNTNPAWVQERVRLFKKYAVESIKRQTNKHFSWLVFVDIETPRGLLEEARKACESAGGEFVYQRGRFDPDSASETIMWRYWGDAEKPDWVITSRFDSDDMLCEDFVQFVQSEFEIAMAGKPDRKFDILLTNGVLYSEDTGTGRVAENMSREFLSCAEPCGDGSFVETCYRVATQRTPKRELRTRAAWAKVLHSSNCLHRGVSGKRLAAVESSVLRDRFGLCTNPKDG